MTERFNIEFDGHQYFLVIDGDNEKCLARLDTRMDALAWLEMYKMLSEKNEQLKQSLNKLLNDEQYWEKKAKQRITELEKENEWIKQTIKEALANERTKIGQSVLKQLLNRIEE